MLVTKAIGRNKSRGLKNRENSRSKSNGRFFNDECYHCNKKGHIKRYCRQLKKENKNKRKEKKNDSSDEDRAATTIEDFLLMCDDDMINSAYDETSWVIDKWCYYSC